MIAILPLIFALQQGVTQTVSPPGGDTVGYWQQRADYRITAQLDETVQVLHGKATLTYVNHSPDTLREMRVQQLLNAFRPGSRWSAADEREGRVRFQRLKEPNYRVREIHRRAEGEWRGGGGHVSVRTRQHDRSLRAAAGPRAGRLGHRRVRVGCAAVRDRVSQAGSKGAALRLLAVVSRRSRCTTAADGRRSRSFRMARCTASSERST